MDSSKIKQELHNYIEKGDKEFLDSMHEAAQTYIVQKELDRMIAEGEEDIEAGRLHSMDEVKKMVLSWTEK